MKDAFHLSPDFMKGTLLSVKVSVTKIVVLKGESVVASRHHEQRQHRPFL